MDNTGDIEKISNLLKATFVGNNEEITSSQELLKQASSSPNFIELLAKIIMNSEISGFQFLLIQIEN